MPANGARKGFSNPSKNGSGAACSQHFLDSLELPLDIPCHINIYIYININRYQKIWGDIHIYFKKHLEIASYIKIYPKTSTNIKILGYIKRCPDISRDIRRYLEIFETSTYIKRYQDTSMTLTHTYLLSWQQGEKLSRSLAFVPWSPSSIEQRPKTISKRLKKHGSGAACNHRWAPRSWNRNTLSIPLGLDSLSRPTGIPNLLEILSKTRLGLPN